ncbi:hypothetical protein GLOTRDRAFT_70128 [Gloeophyllum trabeum ATCC 11539]|uniref:Beta-glucuronidase C-terminal domain-containing protein n=1 Tax=Gloeophyllum trabeum (strain ATCC 11539 / FP-39264 / Madison 617) TaxID=670483 RepID=S7QGX3_GLOTA|nr:uncharacterized protein GLOTRDRAFT_70128 [Gloeophyllum trabeum ATCC 11539]EPQ59016.1 hypothetical protein GLOTRDRAFT_70128 [Gloeophyllum trabeum ATCC 11539]
MFAVHSLLALACAPLVLGATPLTIPSSPSSNTTVYPNFLGISFELSFVGNYFGNSSSAIPAPFLAYLAALSSTAPLRLRLGGNSMDDSSFLPAQSSPLINFTNPQANANDQPVTFGPPLFALLSTVAGSVRGGAQYLLGLGLRDPNDTNTPLLAGAAQAGLGEYLDAFLLGNEPDLYSAHNQRPNLANYTVNDYIGEYYVATANLQNTSAGNILSNHNIAGPTICCNWDLEALLTSGWQSDFQDVLKYITLQHYPQNNCFGSYQYQLDYYLNHTNVQELAQWQAGGLAAATRPVVMSEFNSASCGGIPGISDTFGAALWTADYALQMASVGYSAAYLHTREPGISYNLFEAAPDGWTTLPPYYALLLVSTALGVANGTRVQDLALRDAAQAAYAVYDAASASASDALRALVLFNYRNASGQAAGFAVPQGTFGSGARNVTVKTLRAPSANEAHDIAWGNATLRGVRDGRLVPAAGAGAGEYSVDCGGAGGCTVSVPGPGAAVVFAAQGASGGGNRNGAAARGWRVGVGSVLVGVVGGLVTLL